MEIVVNEIPFEDVGVLSFFKYDHELFMKTDHGHAFCFDKDELNAFVTKDLVESIEVEVKEKVFPVRFESIKIGEGFISEGKQFIKIEEKRAFNLIDNCVQNFEFPWIVHKTNFTLKV